MPHQTHQRLIDALHECAIACDHCAASCLQENDVQRMARCIALDIDCAAICRTASQLLARGSELAPQFIAACAEACEACAAECEKHPMEHCRACAEACRRCAQECRSMAQTQGSPRATGTGAKPAH